MSAGYDVIAAMIAQTAAVGYITNNYAVTLIWERRQTVTAWLATSEGASCIPLGVRVPQDVKLAVTDPVVGRDLWEETAATGGVNPLEVVVRHAKAREMAAPGAQVLAIASSLPMAVVIDWADEVKAKPVEVVAKKVRPAADLDGHMLHRCQVAMPWEWRQANAFTEQDRLRVAGRHMHMAVTAGHLNGAACEKVMRLFEERKPIDYGLWETVRQERFNALVEYESASGGAATGALSRRRAPWRPCATSWALWISPGRQTLRSRSGGRAQQPGFRHRRGRPGHRPVVDEPGRGGLQPAHGPRPGRRDMG